MRRAFTIVELLIVIAIVGVLGAIATPLYVDWRATSLNREAVAFVEQQVATARAEAKRCCDVVDVVLTDGSSALTVGGADLDLPHGGTIEVAGGPITMAFDVVTGTMAPFETIEFGVTTGQGAFARTATVFVVPPLAKVGVVR